MMKRPVHVSRDATSAYLIGEGFPAPKFPPRNLSACSKPLGSPVHVRTPAQIPRRVALIGVQ